MAQTQTITAPRVPAVSPDKAKADIKQLYDNIGKKMGGKVINIFQYMGNSPAVLNGYLSLMDAASKTSLSPQLREELALVVAQANQCDYCLSAHTFFGSKVGLKDQQIIQARKGESSDPKTKAILKFAKLMVEKKGHVTDQEVAALKAANVSDKEFVEIILVVVDSLFTNYFNIIVGTPVDFPEAPKI